MAPDHPTNHPLPGTMKKHYESVLQVLQAKWQDLDMSPPFVQKMSEGLKAWRDLAPGRICGGMFRMRKEVDVKARDAEDNSK